MRHHTRIATALALRAHPGRPQGGASQAPVHTPGCYTDPTPRRTVQYGYVCGKQDGDWCSIIARPARSAGFIKYLVDLN